ncbi:MAG: S-layer homology domain-containing protein [Clostridiales bacterium]|jgi:hypothetical protein|nr:S-layer homology domain-containing protein [Eubacteriales bacterium]MDH7564941.1 S-layer homology domain-containing protein [Clostridiales bacterium]
MKKYISLALIAAILCIATGAYAGGFTDVPGNAVYADALERLSSLGIVSGDGSGQFRPDEIITREQFAKGMVIASGLETVADSMKGSTIFPDVELNGWSSGYINAALNKGLISGMPDGKFHPGESITFAQACTVLVRALGYTDDDVQGLWPKNYVGKAAELGLTAGINLGANDGLPRWAFVLMVDRLLDTNVKKASAGDADQTYAAKVGMTRDNIYSVYSKPEVVKNFNPATKKLGSIDLSGNPPIVRNTIDKSTSPQTNNIGESIKISQIKDYDVVYQVSDAANKNRYILVVDNKVTGNITGILPNKFSPTTIQIDGTDYELGKYFDLNKINSTAGSFKINENVTILLGYDGKVVDIYYPDSSDNTNFAFVVNWGTTTSTDLSDYGKRVYTVKLLLTSGATQTFKVDSDPWDKKGKVVKYQKVYDPNTSTQETSENQLQKVVLEDVPYMNIGEVTVDKDDRQINSTDVTENVKIFNLISNDQGKDCDVSLIDWSDMPTGNLEEGKIAFWNRTGPFSDINVLVLNDAFYDHYRFGVVEKIANDRNSRYEYTLMIDGNEYLYTTYPQIKDTKAGDVVKVEMANNSVNKIVEIPNADAKGVAVGAIDEKRIMVNGNVYRFRDDVKIYFKYYNGVCAEKGINDVKTNWVYGQVDVYLDRPGGKAELVVISIQ